MLKHLEPLPISEEMLGAYLEGNLTAEEVGYVESVIQDNDSLKELMGEITDSQLDYLNTSVVEKYLDFGQNFMDFQLPCIKEDYLIEAQSDLLVGDMINHSDEYQYNGLSNDFKYDDFMNSDDIY